MNKTIVILIIIVIILGGIIGWSFFRLIKKDLTLNVNGRPEIVEELEPITPEGEFKALLDGLENLEFIIIYNKLIFLENSLPFSYNGQDFTSIDQLKNYLADHLLNRDNYSSKERFMNIFKNYIFTSLYMDLLTPKFSSMDNYAYYKKFKSQCPEILLKDLAEYRVADYLDNIVNQSVSLEDYEISRNYYACKATLNKKACNDILKYGQEPEQGDSLAEYYDDCRQSSDESLFFYYVFLSGIPCDEVNFNEIVSARDDNYQELCLFFRKENIDLSLLNMSLTQRLRANIYLTGSSKGCENLEEEYGRDEREKCEFIVDSWLAFSNRDIDKIKELAEIQNDNNVVSELLTEIMVYFIEDPNNITDQFLNQQVINKTYDYSSQAMDEFCDSMLISVNQQICPIIIEDFQAWFNLVKP